LQQGLDLAQELGMEVHWGGLSMVKGWLEILAGTPEAAEPLLRHAYDHLGEIGEQGYRSTVATVLADVVYRQGRYGEAEELARSSEELAAPDDITSQAEWRSVRARVLARRGESDEARLLADEAVELARGTDHLEWQASILSASAEVHQVAGESAEAAAQLEEALRLYEEKGVVPAIERTRALLAELVSPA
jgi:ATP/maltotriose-dependent transcriptional regulator MalT